MKHLKILSFLLFFFAGYNTCSAQDILVKINNDSLRAKVVGITPDKIRFKYNVNDKQVLEIHKNQVKQIIYENGSKLTVIYNRYELSPDMLIPEHRHAIKVDVFAPLLNHLTIGYEFKFFKSRSIEFKLGIIGPYVSRSLKYAEGYFVKGGLKFIKTSTTYMKGLTYVQPLRGSYVKPEIIFGQFRRDETDFQATFTNIAVDFQFGKQYVFGNFAVLDIFGAFGYGYQKSIYKYKDNSRPDEKRDDVTYAYSHFFFGKKLPLIISGGILIGIAF